MNKDFGHPISSNIPGPFRSVRQLALRAETIRCRLAESPSAGVSFSPFGGTTVSGNRRQFLVGQGETRTETPSFYDGGLRCLGHGGPDRSGEAQNLALFGPVERQVLPLSQPARGEPRRLLAFQDGRDYIGGEE